MSEDFDGLMPGDEVTIAGTFTVSEVESGAWGETRIITDSGLDIVDFDYDIASQPRPLNWPPEEGDVWKVDDEYYYYLADEFVDCLNNEFELIPFLSENELTVSSMSLAFRPGVTDRLKK